MNNIVQRTLSGIVFVAAIIGALLGGPLSFCLLFSFLTAWAVHEFYSLVAPEGVKINRAVGITTATLLFVALFLSAGSYIPSSALWALLLLPLIIAITELFRHKKQPVKNLAYTLSGLIYPGLMLSMLSFLYFFPGAETNHHPTLAIGLFILIWTHDTFAYLIGKTLGRHKLFERISPKKTWEGLLGGLVFSLLAAYLFSLFHQGLPVIHWMALGGLVSVMGTLGDLFESLLKRAVGTKDSGQLIPGHGGILDRLDAALFVFPPAFLYLSLIT
jgi:phosphatidate cytidylyltransferase